jgi:alanine-glyoxylate transaminase/serine-glyoxylate transaminase/serine-pyruvate transaminase
MPGVPPRPGAHLRQRKGLADRGQQGHAPRLVSQPQNVERVRNQVGHPSNNILALRASLVKIMAEGLEKRYAHYARIAQAVRTGLRALGFEMFVQDEYASPLTTAVRSHSELSAAKLQELLRKEHRIFIGGGIGPLAGKIFRVGHMGASASWEGTLTFLFAVEDCMRRRGLKIAPGQSLEGLA